MKFVFTPASGFEAPFSRKLDNGFIIETPRTEPGDEFDGPTMRLNFDGFFPLVATFNADGIEFSQGEGVGSRSAVLPGKVRFQEGASRGQRVDLGLTRAFFNVVIGNRTSSRITFQVADGKLVSVA